MEGGPTPLLVRGRTDEGGESPPDPLPLHRPDPHQRIRHRRSPRVQPIRRRRHRVVVAASVGSEALVEAAPEGTGVSGGRAHARLPLPTTGGGRDLLPDGLVVLVMAVHSEGAAGGGGSVDREADGWLRRDGSNEVNAGRGGRSVEEAGRPRREARGGRVGEGGGV